MTVETGFVERQALHIIAVDLLFMLDQLGRISRFIGIGRQHFRGGDDPPKSLPLDLIVWAARTSAALPAITPALSRVRRPGAVSRKLSISSISTSRSPPITSSSASIAAESSTSDRAGADAA
jgi:hypothetical protein